MEYPVGANRLWCIRQNPYKITNQTQMRNLNLSGCLTCPFGHMSEPRNNVMDGTYNVEAQSQDRRFCEEMQIGDYVLIPYAKQKTCVLAQIMSDPIYAIDTKLFTRKVNEQIHIVADGDVPFRPVGRAIQIIRDDITFDDKRVLSQNTLCRIDKNILDPACFY